MSQSIMFGKVKLVYDEPVFKILYDDAPKVIVNTLTEKITFGSGEELDESIDLKCGDIDSETIKISKDEGKRVKWLLINVN